MVCTPLLLLLTLGTAIAPLCAVSKGWAYYHTSTYLGQNLQIWVRVVLELMLSASHPSTRGFMVFNLNGESLFLRGTHRGLKQVLCGRLGM